MTTKTFNLNAPWLIELTMRDFGQDLDGACAPWGNAGHESGGFENLQEDRPTVAGSRGGYGYFQFTGPRRRALEAYCKRNGYSPDDPMANYKWFFVESKGPERRWVSAVKAAVGLKAKTIAFERAYERAGVKHDDRRVEWAEKAKALYLAHPERRQVPAQYVKGTEMEPIKPKSRLESTTVQGIIVSVVGKLITAFIGAKFPGLAGTWEGVFAFLSPLLVSLIGDYIAYRGRLKATQPIEGTRAERVVLDRYVDALNTPAGPTQGQSSSNVILQQSFETVVETIPSLVEGIIKMGTAVRPLMQTPTAPSQPSMGSYPAQQG